MIKARGFHCGTVEINGGVISNSGERSEQYIIAFGVGMGTISFLVDANDVDQALENMGNSEHAEFLQQHQWGTIEPALQVTL